MHGGLLRRWAHRVVAAFRGQRKEKKRGWQRWPVLWRPNKSARPGKGPARAERERGGGRKRGTKKVLLLIVWIACRRAGRAATAAAAPPRSHQLRGARRKKGKSSRRRASSEARTACWGFKKGGQGCLGACPILCAFSGRSRRADGRRATARSRCRPPPPPPPFALPAAPVRRLSGQGGASLFFV